MFDGDVLRIDARAAVAEIGEFIRSSLRDPLRRRGVVVGLSGGVDSAVVAALCARALGPERVLGLLMPERDASPDSLRLGGMAAQAAGIRCLCEDITATLEATGAYERQAEAIRAVFPEFVVGQRFKLTLPSLLEQARPNVFRLTIEVAGGELKTSRMPAHAYLQLVAATNFKQRIRKMLEYYHADRLAYAVAGTPNRLEYDQGFFVKQGDGAADIKPIAHLYKTQVYALAEELGVPEEIRRRPPTTDTFSMPQTQEEFYFSLPWHAMDLSLYAYEHEISALELAAVVGLDEQQCERVYRDIEAKRRTTRYLHVAAMKFDSGAAERERTSDVMRRSPTARDSASGFEALESFAKRA